MFSRPNSRALSHGSSPGSVGDRPGDAVPLQRRALHPEQGDLGLLGGACARCRDAVAAEALDLVEVARRTACCVDGGYGGPGRNCVALAQDERRDVAPSRSEGEGGAGREAVLAGGGALWVAEVEQRGVGAVAGPQREDRRRRGPAERDPAGLGRPGRDRGERGGVVAFDAGHAGIAAALAGTGQGSGRCVGTSTSRAAAATAASGDVRRRACRVYAYGSERRSMAFSASWMAMCIIAYMRDSCSGLSSGAMQAARAASAAFAFQETTAFPADDVAYAGDAPGTSPAPASTVMSVRPIRDGAFPDPIISDLPCRHGASVRRRRSTDSDGRRVGWPRATSARKDSRRRSQG